VGKEEREQREEEGLGKKKKKSKEGQRDSVETCALKGTNSHLCQRGPLWHKWLFFRNVGFQPTTTLHSATTQKTAVKGSNLGKNTQLILCV
jgi:hypothetical protein